MTEQRSVFEPYETFYTTVDHDPTRSRCWQVLPDGSVKEIADDDERVRAPGLTTRDAVTRKVRMVGVEPPRRGTPGTMVLDAKTGEAYVTTGDGKLLRMARMKEAE